MKSFVCAAISFAVLLQTTAVCQAADGPDPRTAPDSPVMLAGDWFEHPHAIDYDALPKIPSQHAVVSDVRAADGVNQHNYLAYHDGQYWVMWSDGPGVEDRVGQVVKYATSRDGLKWSEPKRLTPLPPNSGPDSPHYNTRRAEGLRWISRGMWQRDGELLALASLDEAAGFFGPSLALHAFRWDKQQGEWEPLGPIYDNAINNFPPKRLPTGEWMMTRRPFNYKEAGVQVLIGGVDAIDAWESFRVLSPNNELAAEEPYWWVLPDGKSLMALFRDNRRSGYLFRSFSIDNGRTWSDPVRTDFPDAGSKFNGLRLQDGRYVLVSNGHPRRRDPLTLSISEDGMVFHKMGYLFGGRHVDYPHVIEHDGHLLVAFAGHKQTVEVVKVKLSDLKVLDKMPRAARANKHADNRKPNPASNAWLDLQDEGGELFVTTRLKLASPAAASELVLGTGGTPRVSLGVDPAGRYRLALYETETVGPASSAGTTVTLAARIVSHARKPDEVYLKVYSDNPGDAVPTMPEQDEDWTLIHRAGRSNANLLRVTVAPAAAKEQFSQVRIAKTWQAAWNGPLHEGPLHGGPAIVATAAARPVELTPPDPQTNPTSGLMLDLASSGLDPTKINFQQLPRIESEHAIVNSVIDQRGNRVHQHAYLAFHDGQYWAMWSNGPGISNGYNQVPHHDRAGQHVSYATSKDGLTWSPLGDVCGAPAEGYGWIARGFWQREGELLALASYYHAPGYAGKGLKLEAFRWDKKSNSWQSAGLVLDDSMNNFPPKKLPNGLWMMSRRDSNRHVSVMVGGVKSIDDWRIQPVAKYEGRGRPEEPYWYILPDGNSLVGLFRDNGGSKRLMRAFSTDNGQSWSPMVATNFPDATSKFNALRTSRGYYALVSNANPKKRDPLVLSISRDGLVYTQMLYLVGGRHIDYPHMIEHDGHLLIAFSGVKQTVEVLKIPLKAIDAALAAQD